MHKLLIGIACLSFGLTAWAKDDGKSKKAAVPDRPTALEKKAVPEEKLTGEVLDLNCYTDHKGQGEKHAGCAAKCLAGGAPAGILSDGKVYVITTSDHSSPSAKLAPYAGKKVTLSGHHMLLEGGTHAFIMTAVEGKDPK